MSGFGAGDTIDLTDLSYSANETDVWNSLTDTLTITSGTHSSSITFSGSSYGQNSFALTSDANHNTEVVFSPAQAALSPLDSDGNAVESTAVAATLTDQNAQALSYQWLDNGVAISGATHASYTPVAGDVGSVLDVVVGYTDGGVTEQITAVAGQVAAAPEVSFGSGDASTDENAPLALNPLSVTFADAGSDILTVTLDAINGTLSFGNTEGVSNNGSAAVTLTGTLSAIDTALAGVTYTPDTGFVGVDTVSISATDGAFRSNTATHKANVLGPVATSFTISNAAAPASSGWAYDPENGHYYKYVAATTDDWTDARAAAAADNGAYLATITSGAENVFVSQVIANGATAWTGGETTQDPPNGQQGNSAPFYWLNGPETGTLFTYTSWNNDGLPPGGGEPTGGFGTSVEVLQVGSDGEWNDVPSSWQDAGYVEEVGGLTGQVAFTENTTTDIATSVLLAEDTDTHGGTLTVTSVVATHGTVTLNGGIISYNPDLDYSGADSFSYTISDGTFSSTGTVDFTVAPVPTLLWNTSSGDWIASAANWSSSAAPVATDDVTINAASDALYTVTIANGETALAQMLTLDSAAATLADAGSLTLTGGIAVDAGAFELQGGSLQALSISVASTGNFSGYGTIAGPIAVTGTVEASGGNLDFTGYVAGNGAFSIAAGATLEFDNIVSTGSVVSFAAGTGTLIIEQSTNFQGEVSGVSAGGDVLDLGGLINSNGSTVATQAGDAFQTSTSYNGASGTTLQTVTDEAQGASTFVTLVGDYSNVSWLASSDGSGGGDVTRVVTTGTAPSISTDNIALVSQDSWGGAGEHQGAAVTYADGHLYLSYNNGPATYSAGDTATIVGFNTGSEGPSWTFANAWSDGDFFGVAADGNQIYAAGESYPSYGLTVDSSGGVETKSILVRFDADGVAGSDPSPAEGYSANNFYSYSGFESFNNVIATTQDGSTVLYAFGSGQPFSYSGYIIGEYSSSGTLLASTEDQAGVPGGSSANAAVDWQGAIWAVGTSEHGSETYNSPTVWTFSYNLSSVAIHEDNIGVFGAFNGVATIGSELYAVGEANVSIGQQDYVIAAYNTDGSVAWSETFGPTGTDTLNGAVEVDGRLFVVGSTTSGGATEGVLMEINPTSGSVISTTTYDPGAYNSLTSITTDGQHLYIAGVSGDNVSQDHAVLLTYDIGGTTMTAVEDTAASISSLVVSDASTGSAQIEVTLAVGHGSVQLENSSGLASVVGAGTGSVELFGSQAAINAVLADGVVYNPVSNYTGADTLTITANDLGHNGTGVAQSSTEDVGIVVTAADQIADGTTYTVSAPSGDTIAFVTGSGTLDLAQPATFSGEIAGIVGTGDILDIHGFAAGTTTAATGTGSFDSTLNTTTLTVTDSSDHQTEILTLAGDLSGSTWTVTGDGHGGVDVVDPPAASPTIAGGGSLEIASAVASAETVTFQSSTGSLILDAPSSFHGIIAGFTGDGTLKGSDQIDLRGIDYHSISFTESFNAATDTLSVSDGSDSAALHFTGSYVAANFSFATDGNGGTIVYDPPVPAGAQAPVAAANGHGFVFNFGNAGHETWTDSHPVNDAQHPTVANTLAVWSATHDAGTGHATGAPDGPDAMTSAAIIKAQLHAHDFHFV